MLVPDSTAIFWSPSPWLRFVNSFASSERSCNGVDHSRSFTFVIITLLFNYSRCFGKWARTSPDPGERWKFLSIITNTKRLCQMQNPCQCVFVSLMILSQFEDEWPISVKKSFIGNHTLAGAKKAKLSTHFLSNQTLGEAHITLLM